MNYSNHWLNEKRMNKVYNSALKKTKNKMIVVTMRIVLIGVFVAAAAGVSVALGAYFSIVERAPLLHEIYNPMVIDGNLDSVMVNHITGEEIARLSYGENREYVPIREIPVLMQLAIVAIEDERFFEHDGVDFRGMTRALWVNATTGRTEGASTITQQVIKRMMGHQRNTFETKLQEQVLALNFEQALREELGSKEAAKEYILGMYLNSVPLSGGTVGVQAAALLFFNRDVWDLTLSEMAVLAAQTSNPVRYHPVRRPDQNARRRASVLNTMLRVGFITQEEWDEAMADDVYERVSEVAHAASLLPSTRSYFEDEVIVQVRRDLMDAFGWERTRANQAIFGGGLRIYITKDERIQNIVDAAYLNEALFPATEFEVEVQYHVTIRNENTGLTRSWNNGPNWGIVRSMDDVDEFIENLRNRILRDGDVITNEIVVPVKQPQSAFVVIDHTNGHVVALAGGRGEKVVDAGLNRATRAVRQPGSTFKNIAVYVPAMDLGILTAATVIDDVPWPEEEGAWQPRNWYTNPPFRGLSTVRQGIMDSMNVLAVNALQMVGISNSFMYMENFGFTTLGADDRNLAPLALGGTTTGVTPLELAAAYAAIANGGFYHQPIFYTRVLDHNGDILLENTPEPQQVLRRTTAYIMTDMMVDTIRAGTGGAAALSRNITTIPAAGKTGTTTDTRDLWFVGFTPYYTASVWLGYDQPRQLSRATSGGRYHLRIWAHIMEEIHRPLEHRDFARPEGIETVRVCRQSGMLPVPGLCDYDPRGNQIRSEIFEVGTAPRDFCNVHILVDICVGVQGVSPHRLPTHYCPPDHRTSIVRIRRPAPVYTDRAIRDRPYEAPWEYCTVHGSHGTAPVMVYTPGAGAAPADQHFQPPQPPPAYPLYPAYPAYPPTGGGWQQFFPEFP